MCGIAGLVGPGVDPTMAVHMGNAIAHRGPDGDGLWHTDCVALAHRRLAIIDLVGGRQPMISASGRWVLVFNGEIYNFQELRRGYLAQYPYQTRSDTEVILAALDRWGNGAVCRLEGMFAFAAYDILNKQVLLARDAQGIKPLYYATLPGKQVAFGSEISALFAAGLVPNVDDDALDIFLDIRFVPSPGTMFKGVNRLAPGHCVLVAVDGTVSDQAPFALHAPSLDRLSSTSELEAKIEKSLLRAVDRQLIADVPMGVLLSGGVDSAVVAASAVKCGGSVTSFCVGYDEDDSSNEFVEAKATANFLGIEHHELRIGFSDALSGMSDLIRHVEEPLATTSMFSYFLLCREVAKHRKVVLSGQGADEPWGGYVRHQVSALSKFLDPISRVLPRDILALGPYRDRWRRLKEASTKRNELGKWIGLQSIFPLEERSAIRPGTLLYQKKMLGMLGDVAAFLPADGLSLERLLAMETRTGLPDNLLLLGDKLSMAWGLEVRVPLLDSQYLNVVESIPGYLRRGGLFASRGKLLHKRVCRSLLSSEIVDRKKKGFQSPVGSWFRGQIGSHLSDLVESANSFTRAYLNLHAVRQTIVDHRNGTRGSLELQLFTIWILELWHLEFFVNCYNRKSLY
jgi:asparagine synthase (glutamine-hydrolysing)